MTFNLDLECDFTVDFDYRKVFESVAECAMDVCGCPYEAEVSLIITDDKEIRRINKEYRDTDKVTDVLSFPMTDFDSPADFSRIEDNDDAFDPDSGELILGDIILCAGRVFSQAEEYGHSVLREYAFLIAHSMLHLMGYDHMESNDAGIMEDKQRIIMDELSIGRN
ncbi:MAG: rRNA maturation RNase YbeY [Lachnospiraceae bacterium]|nr:rRNA maturation RNase YbeY [Lachnospiraceae bacterium]